MKIRKTVNKLNKPEEIGCELEVNKTDGNKIFFSDFANSGVYYTLTLDDDYIHKLLKWWMGQAEHKENERKHLENIEKNLQEIITSYDNQIVKIQTEFGHRSDNEKILTAQQNIYKNILHGTSPELVWDGYH